MQTSWYPSLGNFTFLVSVVPKISSRSLIGQFGNWGSSQCFHSWANPGSDSLEQQPHLAPLPLPPCQATSPIELRMVALRWTFGTSNSRRLIRWCRISESTSPTRWAPRDSSVFPCLPCPLNLSWPYRRTLAPFCRVVYDLLSGPSKEPCFGHYLLTESRTVGVVKKMKINEKFQDGQFLIEVTPLIQEQFSFFVFVWPFFANLVKRDLHAIYNINGMYQRQKKKKILKMLKIQI